MKFRKRYAENKRKYKWAGFLAALLILTGMFTMIHKPVMAFSPWSKEGGLYINDKGKPIPGAIKKGIDVSKYQGQINWEAVKASDVEFVIIRCGYGENLENQDDPYWKANVEACERLGIPYGVYLYSYADSVSRAKSEAAHVLRLIKGRKLSYPVYYDIEDSSLLSLSPSAHAKIAKTFCDAIEKAGYKTGINSFKNWFETKLTDGFFNTKTKWVAQYASECAYKGSYGMWQATDKGSVNGIKGNVDINFLMASAPKRVSLKAKSVSYNKQKLTWGKASGATGYEVFRASSSKGAYKKVKTVPAGIRTLTLSASTGKTYYYKVRAYVNANGKILYGAYSTVRTAKSTLARPALTSVKRSSSKKVTLKWKRVSGASGYEIYYSKKKSSGYKRLTVVKKGSAVSSKVSVKKGKRYYYKIKAYRGAGKKKLYSSYSVCKSSK